MSDYPRGKLFPDDEGATQVAVTVANSTVVVRFAKPMRWLGLDYDSAKALGEALLKRAEEIRQ